MKSEVSVSKGVFVYKNGFKKSKKKKTDKTRNLYSENMWYSSYKSLLKTIDKKINEINTNIFSATLSSLTKFVSTSYNNKRDEIPTAVLLTGINMPDHEIQFTALIHEIKENVTPHCVILDSNNCQNLKQMIENMIDGLINDEENFTEFNEEEDERVIKKSQCNLPVLQTWYENLYMSNSNTKPILTSPKKLKTKTRNLLFVVIPDIESFSEEVIQDFILIVNSYLNVLPFVLLFGVATSLETMNRMLPYHVSSKINLQVFSSQSSTIYLSNLLENVFFTEFCPFQLGGKVFSLFMDMFLFFDFSVTTFVTNFKYALIEHFTHGNAMSLCTNEDFKEILNNFTHEDYENIRQLLSFRQLVENETYENRIKLLTDDRYFKEIVIEKLEILRKYKYCLHLLIRCLQILVHDLPGVPLGKQIREIYLAVISKSLIKNNQFLECFQLLNMTSKDVLFNKIEQIIVFLNNNIEINKLYPELKNLAKDLKNFINANFDGLVIDKTSITANEEFNKNLTRKELQEKLLTLSHTENSKTHYEKQRTHILDFLKNLFKKFLVKPSDFTFYEIFFFDDDAIQDHLIGTHRSAIHAALINPWYYLQCSCCTIDDESIILKTMPDISIAYKLHLECGKIINLYDWLQAFVSVLDPSDEDNRSVDPHIQARFTQAIVELEYLGFIKTSKRKVDHCMRLTWAC